MDINKMSRKQFSKLPIIDDLETNVPVNSIVLLPSKKIHDSGYRSYKVVVCWESQPIGICKRTDILDLHFKNKVDLKIDCLNKSKLMRVVLPSCGCELNPIYQEIEWSKVK